MRILQFHLGRFCLEIILASTIKSSLSAPGPVLPASICAACPPRSREGRGGPGCWEEGPYPHFSMAIFCRFWV